MVPRLGFTALDISGGGITTHIRENTERFRGRQKLYRYLSAEDLWRNTSSILSTTAAMFLTRWCWITRVTRWRSRTRTVSMSLVLATASTSCARDGLSTGTVATSG